MSRGRIDRDDVSLSRLGIFEINGDFDVSETSEDELIEWEQRLTDWESNLNQREQRLERMMYDFQNKCDDKNNELPEEQERLRERLQEKLQEITRDEHNAVFDSDSVDGFLQETQERMQEVVREQIQSQQNQDRPSPERTNDRSNIWTVTNAWVDDWAAFMSNDGLDPEADFDVDDDLDHDVW